MAKHGNGRNSKMKHRFDKIFGTDAKYVPGFLILFFKFELRRKITWLVGAWLPWQPYKNLETQFCAHCHNAPTTQVWLTYDISFLSYIRSRV